MFLEINKTLQTRFYFGFIMTSVSLFLCYWWRVKSKHLRTNLSKYIRDVSISIARGNKSAAIWRIETRLAYIITPILILIIWILYISMNCFHIITSINGHFTCRLAFIYCFYNFALNRMIFSRPSLFKSRLEILILFTSKVSNTEFCIETGKVIWKDPSGSYI